MALEIPHFRIVIPARYASHRLPGKPLLLLDNKTMLEHVYICAQQTGAEQIVVATDDHRIAEVAGEFADSVCMTSPEHPSGTDRIAEVATRYGWNDDEIVVNLQGDEPLMPPALVNQVAGNLFASRHASISTLCTPMTDISEYSDTSNVKVVFDRANIALYFSRSVIPFQQTGEPAKPIGSIFRHVGLYAYRVGFLKSFVELEVCEIEQMEKLEQLRALWHGFKIHVEQAIVPPGQDVNTRENLELVEREICKRQQD
jgi:3-deoxy-manno-octulosonate cytidylyltransferase (CMP-KDO synthetase)